MKPRSVRQVHRRIDKLSVVSFGHEDILLLFVVVEHTVVMPYHYEVLQVSARGIRTTGRRSLQQDSIAPDGRIVADFPMFSRQGRARLTKDEDSKCQCSER